MFSDINSKKTKGEMNNVHNLYNLKAHEIVTLCQKSHAVNEALKKV